MHIKEKVALVVGTTALITGTLWMLEPGQTRESIERNQRQQQMEQLSDSQERVQEQHRDQGQDALEAENARRNGTHVPTGPEKGPKIRIRP